MQERVLHGSIWVGVWMLCAWGFRSLSPFPIAFIQSGLVVLVMIAIFYGHTHMILPNLAEKKRYIAYIMTVVLMLGVFSLSVDTVIVGLSPRETLFEEDPCDVYIRENHPEWKEDEEEIVPFFDLESLFFNSMPFAFLLFMSSIYRSSITLRERERREALLIQAESKFLKSQINPHFLFNALNNIYAMAQLEAPETPDAIYQLSGILRYVLYDSNKEWVPLYREIQYLQDFIDLHRLKDEQQLNIETDFDALNNQWQIVPMLFIPFVENSFKHSKIEDTAHGWIRISGKVESNQFVFKVANSIPELPHQKDQQGGIGLENVRRRLELHYPNRHTLTILREETSFSITLTIDLYV